MVNEGWSGKKGLSPQLICFSLFHIRYSYGLWTARFGSVWVRVFSSPSIHITVSNLHLFYTIFYYFLKYIVLHTLESNAISDAFRSKMCHVICMLHCLLLRVISISHLIYYYSICMFVLHTYIFFFFVSLPIDLFDLLSNVARLFFFVLRTRNIYWLWQWIVSVQCVPLKFLCIYFGSVYEIYVCLA